MSAETGKLSFKGTLHLYCLNLFPNDGVSNHCFEMASFWKSIGLNVKLYSFGAREEDRSFIGTQTDLKKNYRAEIDVLFFMFSIGDPFLDEVANWHGKKVIFFQGITPPHLVSEIGHHVSEECKYGLSQIPLVKKFDLVGTSSVFNLKQLQAGNPEFIFKKEMLFCVPPFVSMAKMTKITAVAPATKPKRPFLLYVGRLFPNKNVHQVIELFAQIKRLGYDDLDLYIVGSGSLPSYKAKVLATIASILSNDPESVKFVENVSTSELTWFYENAEALIHLSQHEGFGLTLVEAMRLGTPVITHDYTAIKETMKESGLFIDSANLNQAADIIVGVLNDEYKMRAIASIQSFVFEKYYSDEMLAREYRQVAERMVNLVIASKNS